MLVITELDEGDTAVMSLNLRMCVYAHKHNNVILDWPYHVSLPCLQNEYMKDSFSITIETWHKPDMGEQENVSIVIWQQYLM